MVPFPLGSGKGKEEIRKSRPSRIPMSKYKRIGDTGQKGRQKGRVDGVERMTGTVKGRETGSKTNAVRNGIGVPPITGDKGIREHCTL